MAPGIFQIFFKFIFAKDEHVLRIEPEGRLTLEDEEFIHTFASLKHKLGQELTLDLTKATFVYPSALLFILALRESAAFKVIAEPDSDVYKYLQHCGAIKFLDIQAAESDTLSSFDSDVVRLIHGSVLQGSQHVANQLVDMLKVQQPISALVEANLIDSIEEVLRNVRQHSGYSNFFILGQAYPTSKRIRFAIYDNGIGIKGHLTRLPYEKTHRYFQMKVTKDRYMQLLASPANLAIEEAAKYEVSATDYEDNSGAGLDFLLRRLSSVTNGKVVIVSQDGCVTWEAGVQKSSFALQHNFPGTLVSVSIDCEAGKIIAFKGEFGDE